MSNLSYSNVLVNNEENLDENQREISISNGLNTTMLPSQLSQNFNQISNNSSHSNSSNNIVVHLKSDSNRVVNTLVSSSSQNESLNPKVDNLINSDENNKGNARSTMFYSSSRSSLSSPDSMKKSHQEKFHIFYQKCMKGIFTSINIIKAVMMRLIFSLHSLIAIVFVYWVKEDEWYFVNLVGVVFLQMELFITIIRRKGREPRWYYS